jgi:hypothetical protein
MPAPVGAGIQTFEARSLGKGASYYLPARDGRFMRFRGPALVP